MTLNRSSILFWLFALSILSACKPTRYIKDGEQLLIKTEIHLNENALHESAVTADDLSSIIKQKPVRKILGIIPFHVGVWNFANRFDQSKRRTQYLQNTVGEAPVIFDLGLMYKSRDQMQQYLKNKGYFDAEVTAYPLIGNKTAEAIFYVYTGPAYRIRTVGYIFEDLGLKREFDIEENTALHMSKISRGSRFDTEQFDLERSSLVEAFKNLGYFSFEKIHVSFDVDTAMAGEKCDVQIRLRKQRISTQINGVDTVVQAPHLKHTLHSVSINQNYEAIQTGQNRFDSTSYRGYTFLYLDKPYISFKRVHRNIFTHPGDLYSLEKSNYTYERISSLNNFRFIDIRYEAADQQDSLPALDMTINLTKASKQSISLETIGTNRAGNLGISAGLNYKNKNLLGGAEQLDTKVYGGLEVQRTNSTLDQNSQVTRLLPFNTLEYGTQVSITVPDLMLLPKFREVTILKEPKTSVSIALDRQLRPQFDRNLINLSYQYVTRFSKKDQLTFAPIDLSVIKLIKDPEFEKRLLQSGNSLLINSFKNHIIAAGRLSYSYSTQDLKNPLKNYYNIKFNLESAGFILRKLAGPLGLQFDQISEQKRSYLIEGIAFSDYLKFDVDYRKTFNLTKSSKYLIRTFTGIGVPRKNLNTLPFERSYFAGGANDIRAWQARGLGPGNLADTASYYSDQVGNLQLEVNIEYRFDLFRQLKGAVFADVGNIWLLSYDPLREGANFEYKNFYKAIAVGPGAGLRADLSFFVLRFDMGLQLHDPALPSGERWLWEPKTLTNTYRNESNARSSNSDIPLWKGPKITGNLAIGWPF